MRYTLILIGVSGWKGERMERLNDYQKAQKWLETFDWDNCPNADDNLATICEALQDMAKYKALEEQGLLLKPPCSIGSDVYFIPSKVNFELNKINGHEESNRVYHQKVAKIVFTERGWHLECDKDLEYGTDHILVDKFYKKTWFLSPVEAATALRKMEGK